MDEKSNDVESSDKKPRGIAKDYPTLPLESALDVSKAIRKCGGFVSSSATLSNALNVRGGALFEKISSARRYGLVQQRELRNTELAMRILKPTYQNEDIRAKKDAVMSVKLFKDVYDRFGTNPPHDTLFSNILHREFQVNESTTSKILYAIKKNNDILLSSDLGETKGTESDQKKYDDVSIEPISPCIEKDGGFRIIIKSNVGTFSHPMNSETDWDIVRLYLQSLKEKATKYTNITENDTKNDAHDS